MRPNDFMLEVFQPWIRGFRELFVMPESIYSIQRHFIGNSTNASGAKGCACPAGKGELKVCMSFEPHFISSPGIRAFPPFFGHFSPFVGHQGVKQCVRHCWPKGGKGENYLHSQDLCCHGAKPTSSS